MDNLRQTSPASSTPFAATWVAEIIRQQEAAQGPYDDRQVQRHWIEESDLETRVLRRARILAERHELAPAIDRYQFSWRFTLGLLSLIAVISGISLAMQITPTQVRTVSLIEALIMLIALNALFIIIWAVSMMAKPRARGLGGWLFKLISSRPHSSRLHKTDLLRVAKAHTSVLHRYHLLKPTFSSVSHLVWTLLLTAALLTLVARFVAFEYEFVWRTTLLNDAQINALLNTFHALPSLFGLPRPAVDQLSGFPENNRAVALWLLACVCLYALLPRLLLLLGSVWVYHRRAKYLPIDWSLAGFSELHQQWQRSATDEVDPPPTVIQRRGPNAMNRTFATTPATNDVLEQVRLHPQLVITVDWPAAAQRQLTDQMQDYPDVSVCSANSAAERQQLLEALHRHASAAPRLLVLINAQLSPDRGTLRFIDTLTEYTTPELGLVSDTAQTKVRVWHDYVGEHLADINLVTSPSSAVGSFAENAFAITCKWLTTP